MFLERLEAPWEGSLDAFWAPFADFAGFRFPGCFWQRLGGVFKRLEASSGCFFESESTSLHWSLAVFSFLVKQEIHELPSRSALRLLCLELLLLRVCMKPASILRGLCPMDYVPGRGHPENQARAKRARRF